MALLIFLYLTAAALWQFHWFALDYFTAFQWFDLNAALPYFYWTCVAILIWIFATVGITHMLQNLESMCDALYHSVDAQMKLMAEDVTRYAALTDADKEAAE